jgi:hypothetical protein
MGADAVLALVPMYSKGNWSLKINRKDGTGSKKS